MEQSSRKRSFAAKQREVKGLKGHVGCGGDLVLFVYVYFKAEETRARFSVGTEGAGDGERAMH